MKTHALALVLATLAGTTPAQVLTSDDFGYSGLLTDNGWATLGGASDPVSADGSVATLVHTPSSDFGVYKSFAPQGAVDTTYVLCHVEVASGTSFTSGEFVNFLSFGTAGVTPFGTGLGSVGLVPPAGGGDYRLRLWAGGLLSLPVVWLADLSFDTQYTVVLSWDAATGDSKLWIDPVDILSTNISSTGTMTTGSLLERVALHQRGATSTATMEIDDLIVGASFYDVLPSGGGPTGYCTGKTSSLGCVPFVSSTGMPSATSPSPFRILANDVAPTEAGFVLYSFKKSNLNFHGGKLCVKVPFVRLLPPKLPSNAGTPPCVGTLRRNFNNTIQSGNDPQLTAGQTVFAQWRQRDPLDPAGFGDSLTNGLRFTIAP